MLTMILDAVKLFFTGRLFADYKMVMTRAIATALLGALVTVGLGIVSKNWMLAATAGGAIGGGLLPFLFKNLKYK